MKGTHYMVVLVVALALLGGYLVYPRSPELALMRYKNKQYTAARAEYERLLEEGNSSADVVVPLSELYLVYGDMNRAVDLMERFVEANPDNLEARIYLGKLYQQTQRPHDYLGNLEKRAEVQPSEEALRNLSQLYNAEGRIGQQIEVLKRIVQDYDAKPQDYKDLAYLLAAEGDMVSASDVLRRLGREYPSAFDERVREFLVSLSLDLGQYEGALEYLRGYGDRGGRWTAYYERALAGATRYVELYAFWDRQLTRPDLDPQEKIEISYRYENTLRKLGQEEKRIAFLLRELYREDLDGQQRREVGERYEAALRENGRIATLLEYLGEQIGRPDIGVEERKVFTYRYETVLRKEKRWQELFAFWQRQMARPELSDRERLEISYRYEAALRKLGKQKELLAVLRQRYKQLRLSRKEKRALAYDALDLGDKVLAEQVYMDLAQGEPAYSIYVSQLLYIWGPRPEPYGLQWIEDRVSGAHGKQRLAWLRRLLEVGATELVLKLGQQDLAELGYSGDPVEFQMDVLQREEDYPRLRQVLTRAIAEAQSAEQLRRHIRRADQVGFADLAIEASRRLLSVDPEDPEMLRRLGLLAYREERWEEAYELLSRYLENNEGDFESNYFLAELLTRRNRELRAAPHYRRVVRLLEADGEMDLRRASVRAQSLYRLGESDNAILAYQDLLERYPDNLDLRADFVTVLLESGRIERAEAVLAGGGDDI
ncbi:MAG TPA: tetratricopeptide repeat protein [Gammaproteobacteria bacterium]|nr:tetratricopeptide repeat protein [Gammaproteobacteria bacterium]